MINWSDYGKELLLLTVDTFVVACAWKWYRNSSKAVAALDAPVITDHKGLEYWLSEGGGKWAVVQGFVEPIGPVIHSFNDKSVKGVIQRLKVKEYVTSRSTAGFWQDGERVIADTSNVVPFGVRVGKSLVEMEEPVEAAALSLRTVASEFSQKSSGFLDQLWSFLVGTRHRGIQSTEEMLLVGTKISACGPIAKDKTLSPVNGASMRPYILTELTVSELSKKLKVSKRWSVVLLLVASFAGALVVSYTLRRAFENHRAKAAEDERRRRRFETKRLEEKRRAEQSDQSTACIICDNPREVILLPCGHICLCFDCSKSINNLCPICRAHVETITEYFIS
ncbi:mitochondrial E3 ubiquitin protein ligase 1-like [Neocloeon triangulifer]|uniref:mitochondrial E3 ubiquitin protein ligase 1-like n=1 Tax=Neocloeon triangulifer TaxID=2078957 RepID=UPI00286EF073|nr:mitochondrial E3 ubiquitin protein ligase 1-like [Neocloeon triangulifer]